MTSDGVYEVWRVWLDMPHNTAAFYVRMNDWSQMVIRPSATTPVCLDPGVISMIDWRA